MKDAIITRVRIEVLSVHAMMLQYRTTQAPTPELDERLSTDSESPGEAL